MRRIRPSLARPCRAILLVLIVSAWMMMTSPAAFADNAQPPDNPLADQRALDAQKALDSATATCNNSKGGYTGTYGGGGGASAATCLQITDLTAKNNAAQADAKNHVWSQDDISAANQQLKDAQTFCGVGPDGKQISPTRPVDPNNPDCKKAAGLKASLDALANAPAGGAPGAAGPDPTASCAVSDTAACPAADAAAAKAAADAAAKKQAQTGSAIAAQCNSDKEVPEQWTNTWVGLTPATLNCGAITSLDWTVRELGVSLDNTKIDIINGTAQNNGKWFQIEFGLIEMMTIWTIPPIFFIAAIHAVSSGHYDRLLKSALVYLPIALFGTAFAMFAVQQILNVTDDISATFLGSIQGDAQVFFVAIAKGFGPDGYVINGGAWIMSLILALGLLFATMVVYIVLTIRESAIYIAVLFLPIVFAMLIWPPLQKYFKRLIEFLIGMILSKIVMVAGIALTVSLMVATAGLDTTQATALGLQGQHAGLDAASSGQIGQWTWVSLTVTSIFMFAIFMFAPNMCSKLVSNVGYEETGSMQAASQNRLNTHRKVDLVNRQLGSAKEARNAIRNLRELGSARAAGLSDPPGERLRNNLGLGREFRPMTEDQVRARGYEPRAGAAHGSVRQDYRNMAYECIMRWGNSGQYDQERIAQALMIVGYGKLEQFDVNEGHLGDAAPTPDGEIPMDLGQGGFHRMTWRRTAHNGEERLRTDVLMNGFTGNNEVMQITPEMVEAAIQDTLQRMPRTEDRVNELVIHIPETPGYSQMTSEQVDRITAKYKVDINIAGTPQAKASGNGTARERNPAFGK